jgi:hypothetical protein
VVDRSATNCRPPRPLTSRGRRSTLRDEGLPPRPASPQASGSQPRPAAPGRSEAEAETEHDPADLRPPANPPQAYRPTTTNHGRRPPTTESTESAHTPHAPQYPGVPSDTQRRGSPRRRGGVGHAVCGPRRRPAGQARRAGRGRLPSAAGRGSGAIRPPCGGVPVQQHRRGGSEWLGDRVARHLPARARAALLPSSAASETERSGSASERCRAADSSRSRGCAGFHPAPHPRLTR